MSIISPSSPLFRGFISLTTFSFILSLGMSLTIAQLRAFWQQSGLLVRTLLATVVLPPLMLALLILIVDLPKPVPIALALLMASPCPPFLSRRAGKAGASVEFALSLQVTLALGSIIATPLVLSLFQAGFPTASDIKLDSLGIVKQVVWVQFLPLGIGFGIRQIQGAWVEKFATILNTLSKILFLLMVIVLTVLVFASNLLLKLGWLSFIAIALFNVLVLVVGHIFAIGYEPQIQAGIAVSAIARNAGLALFIAASLNRNDAILTIVAAQFIGIIVNLPYAQWMKRKYSATISK